MLFSWSQFLGIGLDVRLSVLSSLSACEYWTYVVAPIQNKACYLKSGCPINFPDFNAYSGSKDCIFWDCSDHTNVEACQTTMAPKIH